MEESRKYGPSHPGTPGSSSSALKPSSVVGYLPVSCRNSFKQKTTALRSACSFGIVSTSLAQLHARMHRAAITIWLNMREVCIIFTSEATTMATDSGSGKAVLNRVSSIFPRSSTLSLFTDTRGIFVCELRSSRSGGVAPAKRGGHDVEASPLFCPPGVPLRSTPSYSCAALSALSCASTPTPAYGHGAAPVLTFGQHELVAGVVDPLLQAVHQLRPLRAHGVVVREIGQLIGIVVQVEHLPRHALETAKLPAILGH